MSGCSSSTLFTATLPFSASPHTDHSECPSSHERSSRRTRLLSSTIRIVCFTHACFLLGKLQAGPCRSARRTATGKGVLAYRSLNPKRHTVYTVHYRTLACAIWDSSAHLVPIRDTCRNSVAYRSRGPLFTSLTAGASFNKACRSSGRVYISSFPSGVRGHFS